MGHFVYLTLSVFFFFTEKEHNFQKKLYRITSPQEKQSKLSELTQIFYGLSSVLSKNLR